MVTIATPVLSDVAVVTTSSETVAGPVTNLQKIQPTDAWETVNLTSIFIEINLNSIVTFNQIALLFTNVTSAGTVRFRTADTQANLTAAPTNDRSGLAPDGQHLFTHFDTDVSAKWVRIDIADAGNPAGKITGGRLYVAKSWKPIVPYGNITQSIRDLSKLFITSGGQTVINKKPIIPDVTFTALATSEADILDNADEINRIRGASNDVFVVVDTTVSSRRFRGMYYGLLGSGQPFIRPNLGIFQQTFVVKGIV